MKATPDLNGERERVLFLARVVEREAAYLSDTDHRLFALPMTAERASNLPYDALLPERVDAFVARFARLQDTLADKLLPALLRWLGERVQALGGSFTLECATPQGARLQVHLPLAAATGAPA